MPVISMQGRVSWNIPFSRCCGLQRSLTLLDYQIHIIIANAGFFGDRANYLRGGA